MRTHSPRLDARSITAGRGRARCDGTLLTAIACIVAAALLYLMYATLWGAGDDAETLGSVDDVLPMAVAQRSV